jgi:F-type H+-transporting ATPase subunit delta
MLIDSGKGGELAGVAEAFVSLSQEKKNKVLAEVTSAVSLTPELTDKLKDTLAKNTGKNISVKNTVDAAILGGLIIKMEDKIIDLSVRRRLGALQDSLRSNL